MTARIFQLPEPPALVHGAKLGGLCGSCNRAQPRVVVLPRKKGTMYRAHEVSPLEAKLAGAFAGPNRTKVWFAKSKEEVRGERKTKSHGIAARRQRASCYEDED
jgi:hypothetical protein